MKIASSLWAAVLSFIATAYAQKVIVSSFDSLNENGECQGALLQSAFLDVKQKPDHWTECIKTDGEAQCASMRSLLGFNEVCTVHVWAGDNCQDGEIRNWPISLKGNHASYPGTKWKSLKIRCNEGLKPDADNPVPDAQCKLPLPGGRWPSANETDFPTVKSIIEDMKICGNIGPNTTFYSFGATTAQAIPFRDSIGGFMFNDALPGSWTQAMAERFPILARQIPQQVLAARIAEAMAYLSRGDVYLVTADNRGAYTVPNPPQAGQGPNVWRFVEFPTLQRNRLISKVIRVTNTQPFQKTVDWESFQGDKYPELPPSIASSLDPNLPSLPPPVLPENPPSRFRKI